MDDASQPKGPLSLHREPVQEAWIDYNGHMNMAYYMVVFDHASDAVMAFLGIDQAYVRAGRGTLFVVESHVTYSREVALGDPLRIDSLILGSDARRLHLCHRMFHDRDGFAAATNELILLHVDVESRRTAPMPAAIQDKAAAVAAAHAVLPRPPGLSRRMGLDRKGGS